MNPSISMDLQPKQTCPLCDHPESRPFYQDKQRTYLRCPECSLIFVDRQDLLSPSEEKTRYDLHENDPQDSGYRQFLGQFLTPLTDRLAPPPRSGLDFGSGPGPALAIMLKELGYAVEIYDPFYAPDPAVLLTTYDFVTATETFEHFYQPKREWQLLLRLIKPGGLLGVMTLLMDDPDSFPNSHYNKDDTHVSFFSRQTFQYLAQQEGLKVEFIGDRITFFYKPEGKQSAEDVR